MDFTRLFFWNLNGKLCGPGLNLYWSDWGEIEWRIWGERWSWPQPFHFLPPCSPHLALPSRHFLGKVEENIPLTVGTESLQLYLSLFIFTHLSARWFIVPLHSLSGVQCSHFLSLCTHTQARMHSQTFFTFIYSVSSPASPLCSLFFSPAVAEILDVLACLLSSPHRQWGGSRRVYRPRRVCWGVKDPLSPKPSPVHPTESPDGVIQSSWSLANS